MDLVYAFEIVNLDHSFYVCEFIEVQQDRRPSGMVNDPSSKVRIDDTSVGATTLADEAATKDKEDNLITGDFDPSDDPLGMFDNLIPIEDGTDAYLEAFMALINE